MAPLGQSGSRGHPGPGAGSASAEGGAGQYVDTAGRPGAGPGQLTHPQPSQPSPLRFRDGHQVVPHVLQGWILGIGRSHPR